MNPTNLLRTALAAFLPALIVSACSSTKVIKEEGFTKSEADAHAILSKIPDYGNSISTIRGKGKAIVSEPGNTERVTINFQSNRQKSLLTVKNTLGIEGGKLLTDGETLLIYDKIEKVARRVSIAEGNLSRIDNLASLNLLTLINYTADAGNARTILENEAYFQVVLKSGTRITIDKETHTVRQVREPASSPLPYSKIVYEAYGQINGFTLPRRITIFSSDAASRVAFLIQSLEINPTLDELTIELPDNTTIYSQ